jgi:hypothetical protein
MRRLKKINQRKILLDLLYIISYLYDGMARPFEGEIKLNHKQLVKLADKLFEKYKNNPDILLLKELTTEEGIPFEMFIDKFCKEDFYFNQKWSLLMDMQEVRYTKAVMEKKIPPTFGIFQTKQKHIANYADRQTLSKKKEELPDGKTIKSIIEEQADKVLQEPE